VEVYREFRRDVFWSVLFMLGWGIGHYFLDVAKDATDPVVGRSGLSLRVDYGTGLHYLESSGGHLIPRLGSDGVQVREGVERE